MSEAATKIGNYRYRILALLIYSTTVNYFDRGLIGALSPVLFRIFEWTNDDYANILIFFQIAYAIGMLTMGGIIDRLGTKNGYTLAISIWSIFGMLHAAVRPAFSIVGFSLARFGLGFGESGHFPAAQKTVAEWFPKKERAFATGLYNAATSIGAIMAPFVVGWVVNETTGVGWQIPFLITGVISGFWIFLWRRYYTKPEENKNLSKEELAYINSDPKGAESEEKLPWVKVIGKKQAWAFAAAKLTDAVWWFYLFWGAKFLSDKFEVDIKHLGIPFFIMYALADGGSILGGWISGQFLNKGWTLNKARKMTLLMCAIIILPVCYVAITNNQWIAVVLIGIGAAGHQAWSANIFTLVSDIFPKKAVASVTGLGGMSGAIAGMISFKLLGQSLDASGNEGYFWAFFVAGSCYLIVLGVVHLLMPSMTPLDDNLQEVK